MTGPEHYKEAEKLLDLAGEAPMGSDPERYALVAAQVHATLALAAAQAMPNAGQMDIHDCEAWEEAAGGEAALQRRLEAADEEHQKLIEGGE